MAGKWLPEAQLTGSGRPILQPGEVESSLLSSVDLECEENPNFPQFKSGVLILTTHRILWIDETNHSGSVAIPLGAVTHIFSLKKSIKNMFASPRIRFQVSASADGRIEEKGPRSTVITLVLRGKSDPDSFLSRFWEAWRSRSWEILSPESSGSSDLREKGFGAVEGSSGVRTAMAGVSGILRKEQEMWESTDKSLQDAFQDLNALMSKAKDMVMLAEKMRQKLLSGSTAQANATNDEEMGSKQEMQDWLLSVGIASPVTKESAGAMYHQQLSRQELYWFVHGSLPQLIRFGGKLVPLMVEAFIKTMVLDKISTIYHLNHCGMLMPCRCVICKKLEEDVIFINAQLADFVKLPLERAGGMINLVDVYCHFNRARGTELISPEDLLQACSIWEKFDVPVMLRKFDSGVMVIQNKSHSDEEVFARIKSLVLNLDALGTGISPSDAAMTLGIAPAMAKEHLLTAESKGILCRDTSPEGFRFYINLFKEIDPKAMYSRKVSIQRNISEGVLDKNVLDPKGSEEEIKGSLPVNANQQNQKGKESSHLVEVIMEEEVTMVAQGVIEQPTLSGNIEESPESHSTVVVEGSNIYPESNRVARTEEDLIENITVVRVVEEASYCSAKESDKELPINNSEGFDNSHIAQIDKEEASAHSQMVEAEKSSRYDIDEVDKLLYDEHHSLVAANIIQRSLLSEGSTLNNDLIDCIPNIILEEENEDLCCIPDSEEIKNIIFSMSDSGVLGPDGFTRQCVIQDHLKNYILQAVGVLFPKLKFEEQSAFVRGWNIVDNISIAQDLASNVTYFSQMTLFSFATARGNS
ncbi:hypothetical protein HHK36_011583 [Tetracentron sinense]|uniref:Vacuolar protein-sorting-associated protein 36 n=1 Tax=Tetracentron sinense TaxID=13715 RepID=A0A834Z8J8_TETSI|nr:hypothetical protein HHK36_011583 [Tetracentron sinense]